MSDLASRKVRPEFALSEAINIRYGAPEKSLSILCARIRGRTFERVPAVAKRIGAFVDRKVALEHTAICTKRLDTRKLLAPGRSSCFDRGTLETLELRERLERAPFVFFEILQEGLVVFLDPA